MKNITVARSTLTGLYFVKSKGFVALTSMGASALTTVEASLAKFTWENVEFIQVERR